MIYTEREQAEILQELKELGKALLADPQKMERFMTKPELD